MDKWTNALEQDINISVLTKTLPKKGNLVYEYNPLRNYRLSEDMYEYDDQYFTISQLKENYGITYNEETDTWEGHNIKTEDDYPIVRQKGELVDFITDELNFDLSHPVTMIPQYSYDGSVNLILNDGINTPKLINTRFSATANNTYEIVDRKGDDDTNIYDQGENFNTDVSLYKVVSKIPKLELLDVSSGGNLKCGTYQFFFKLADADGNESDFIAESGLVSIFVGSDYPQAIHSGNRDENAVKQVTFKLSNLDTAYSYVTVYYSRNTAEDGNNRVASYGKILFKYPITNFAECKILITGFEKVDTDITLADINIRYDIIDAAKTATTAQGMLFLGNVHKPTIPHNELQQLSLRFLPYLKDKKYELDIDQNYDIHSTSKGYYDPLYIYNNVGYWNKELYRLGIVYILNTGELTPVYDIRGCIDLKEFQIDANWDNLENSEHVSTDIQYYCDSQYSYFKQEDEIDYNSSTNLIIPPNYWTRGKQGNGNNENVKGVISFDSSDDSNIVHTIEIRVENETIQKLKSYGVRGYFFVRQKRIPLILTQGITIGVDKVGRLPTIPTKGGLLETFVDEISTNTYVETKDINNHNFISEGFLTRYKFDLKAKSSSFWSKILKVTLISAVVVGVVTSAVLTAGGSLPFLGAATGELVGLAAVQSIVGASLSAIVYGGIVGAAVGAAAGAATVVIGSSIDELVKAISRSFHPKQLKGKNTEIPNGYKRVENDDSRLLGDTFANRIIIKDYTHNDIAGILCPDYDVVPQYYNQLFTGGTFVVKPTKFQPKTNMFIDAYAQEDSNKIDTIKTGYFFTNEDRHFYMPFKGYTNVNTDLNYEVKLQTVPDNVTCVTVGKTKFRSKAGDSAIVQSYQYIGEDYTNIPSYYSESSEENSEETSNTQTAITSDLSVEEINDRTAEKEINSDIVRGSYGPYIGMVDYNGQVGETISIMTPGYSEALMGEYIKRRMDNRDTYHAITDRIDINDLQSYQVVKSQLSGDLNNIPIYTFNATRGDCYICQFTHRVNRNFNDSVAPYNSEIIDAKTWKNNYKLQKSESFEKINLGDVNAVNLGMWVTFTIRSNRNLNIRSLDEQNLEESVLMGHPRGFFPHDGLNVEGNYKSPESLVYNDGFAKTSGDRFYTQQEDSPYNTDDKNWHDTRIIHSAIQIDNGYYNSYRVFINNEGTDYTHQYGSITKILNYNDNILVIFEHGIALIPVKERAIATQSESGYSYINTSKVLPDNPAIISGSYGSLWPDSIVKTPSNGVSKECVYGVDTVAKKIWKVQPGGLEIISDMKVQEFLNNNITLTEREMTPILGIRNVKTVYNDFKHDVIFTFYDDLSTIEEKSWSLCYNEVLSKFITFYSWMPSFMENINNIPFSFNRTVSKWIAKLGQSKQDSSFSEGIVLSNNIYDIYGNPTGGLYYKYKATSGEIIEYEILQHTINDYSLLGVLNLNKDVLPEGEDIDYYFKFELLRDIYGYYKNFKIYEINDSYFKNNKVPNHPVYGLYLKKNTSGNKCIPYLTELYYRNYAGHTYNDYDDYKITAQEIDSDHCSFENKSKLTLDNYFDIVCNENLPIFHNREGSIPSLPTPINKQFIVQLLNIKATIYATSKKQSGEEALKDFMLRTNTTTNTSGLKDNLTISTQWVNIGEYESSIAVTSDWNIQYLTSDFWRHGQAGSFDKTEDILPTKWYGEQHPFEFEVVIKGDDTTTQKIFRNLEIVANKAQPESFHYEIIGESYDFAKDKPNMYFRQEARKALLQYNGCDITYDNSFRKINPKQQAKSAELIHSYFERQDTLNDTYDTYNLKDSIKESFFPQYVAWANQSPNHDYRHLSGAEIVYYKTRQEYRIWQHQPAININNLSQDTAVSLIRGNCQYLEDKWLVQINPLLVCYKNEYTRKVSGALCQPENSTWAYAQTDTHEQSNTRIPPITIKNTCLPNAIVKKGELSFPNEQEGAGKDNALYGLYYDPKDGSFPQVDSTNWLNDISISKMNFGEAQNRKETDLRDKFIKIRIRYSGEELAIIDALKTMYTLSYV